MTIWVERLLNERFTDQAEAKVHTVPGRQTRTGKNLIEINKCLRKCNSLKLCVYPCNSQ